jgi:hypothetical protein
MTTQNQTMIGYHGRYDARTNSQRTNVVPRWFFGSNRYCFSPVWPWIPRQLEIQASSAVAAVASPPDDIPSRSA